jgi:protocatechuate 3,4-dioxygenase beta subunit
VSEQPAVTRKRLLAWAGGLGMTALLPGCATNDAGDGAKSGNEAAARSTTTGPSKSTATRATPDCTLAPELTEGPFYLDLDLIRRDITEGRPGTPLALTVTVVDADSCGPIPDAAVDVWHCDAAGVYSGVEGGSGTFLRGVQLTDDRGTATFRTIYPGWYSGRAVHIHLKVHLGASEAHTGQLFFDDAVTRAVYERAPYNARPGPDVLNEADGIFAESRGVTVVSVQPDEPYRGGVTLGIARE